MKFVNSSQELQNANTDTNKVLEISYNKVGKAISDESEFIFAKSVSSDSNVKYAILVHNNQPYDPYGVDSHRQSSLSLKIKQVNKDTFNNYISYLRTKNSLYMTRSQRSFING
jgi:hypothetical protein